MIQFRLTYIQWNQIFHKNTNGQYAGLLKIRNEIMAKCSEIADIL